MSFLCLLARSHDRHLPPSWLKPRGQQKPFKAVPTSSASQSPATTPQKPVAAPRVKLMVSPAATNTVLDKAVGRMAPVRDTQSVPSQSSVPTGRLAGLAQASSNIQSCSRDSISPNSRPTLKRPRLDGTAEPTTTTSSTPGSSSATAIPIDDDDDEIQFIDAIEDGASVHVDAHGTQTTTSSFNLQPLDDELVAEFPPRVRDVMNRLCRNHYSTDLPWMQDLHWRLPQDTRNTRNVDPMVAHVLAAQETNPYIKKSFKSVERILNGDEDPEFFDADFKKTLANVRCNQTFKLPLYCNMKNFQFDYILACFLDEDDNPFPPNDKRFRMQMMGLTSLHSVLSLGCPKIRAHGMSIEKIFCPHCGYFVNNPGTMSTHICMPLSCRHVLRPQGV